MGRKLVVLLVGVLSSMFGILLYTGSRWTPLQNHYFHAYLASSGSSGKGSYSLLFVRYPSGWRMAVNKDVVNASRTRDPVRAGIFALSDEARRAGADALEWRFFPELDDATAVQWFRERIFDGESPWELIRWPVSAAFIFVGVLM